MVLAQACTPEAVPRERVTVGGLNDRVALDTADRSRAGGRTERGGAVGAAQLVDRGGCAPSVVVVAALVVVAVVVMILVLAAAVLMILAAAVIVVLAHHPRRELDALIEGSVGMVADRALVVRTRAG